MRQHWAEIEEQQSSFDLEKYPFLELHSPKDFNKLDHFLSDRYCAGCFFMEGDKPSSLDRQLFHKILSKVRIKRFNLSLVLTTEQLAVFEGPRKQLIIGPPGSGKTELLKFKALELEMKMKSCGEEKKILYIVANGSVGYHNKDSLICHHIKEFFQKKKSTLVEVTTIILQREFSRELEHTVADLTEKIDSKKYGHIFVDEYWIGSKPIEHDIILKLIKGIPGYVWITSVFDYNPKKILSNERMKTCTGPLLTCLEENGGAVSHITQVMRATNCVIELEKGYGSIYQDRSYPYGTRNVLGHSMEGLPITWAVEKDLDGMYTRCVDVIDSTLRKSSAVLSNEISREVPKFDPADIMIVNFAVRMKSSGIKLENYLDAKKIRFLSFGKSLEEILSRQAGLVNLLQSLTRENSSYLDGNEWPMVIIILPSGLLLNTAELASRETESLRNYDPYIACFRTMVKLVVISDKWQNSEEFLTDIKAKP